MPQKTFWTEAAMSFVYIPISLCGSGVSVTSVGDLRTLPKVWGGGVWLVERPQPIRILHLSSPSRVLPVLQVKRDNTLFTPRRPQWDVVAFTAKMERLVILACAVAVALSDPTVYFKEEFGGEYFSNNSMPIDSLPYAGLSPAAQYGYPAYLRYVDGSRKV